MNKKKWLIGGLGLLALAAALIAAFNIIVDPFGVFGDRFFNWYSYNMTQETSVAKIAYLERHHEEYDSYILGSGSASAYLPETLEQYQDARYYNLFTQSCSAAEYQALAEYLLAHYEVRNLILCIGPEEAQASRGPVKQHAAVTGENRLAFYLKYAFASPGYGIDKLRSRAADTVLAQPFDQFLAETGCYDRRAEDVSRLEETAPEASPPEVGDEAAALPRAAECAQAVAAISRLCRAQSVALTVVFSPVYAGLWDLSGSDTLRAYKELLADAADYWDFSSSAISFESRYFYDEHHFRNAVGDMVLAKIFDEAAGCAPENFGIRVTKETAGAPADFSAADVSRYTADVPVLMYHHFDQTAQNETTVSAALFEEQIRALSEAGYQAVSFEEMIRYVDDGIPLPEKPVCITMDDGYLSNYEIAFPILKKYNMKATIFAIGCSIGRDTYKDTAFSITPHFSYAQAAEMMDSGLISIQSHTYDMHQWPPYETGEQVRKNIDRFADEAEEAYIAVLEEDTQQYRAEFEAQTGHTLNVLAYPGGVYNTLSEVTFRRLGFRVTLTTQSDSVNTLVQGLPQSLFALYRYDITEELTAAALLEMLTAV